MIIKYEIYNAYERPQSAKYFREELQKLKVKFKERFYGSPLTTMVIFEVYVRDSDKIKVKLLKEIYENLAW